MPDTHLILHVKGTEQETTTLPKQVVRAAISQGQITHSQLIWVPENNAWKQVRELPHLLPSQKLAPAPVRVPTGPLPKVASEPRIVTASGSVPRIAKNQTGPVPKVKVAQAVAVTPVARATASVPVAKKSYVVKEENPGSHPLKWLSIGLGGVILLIVAVNYLLIERPLSSGMAQTSFSSVPVYAHLGGYIQPNVIVIHIPKSSAVTSANLTDFLVALAKSTPTIPMSGNLFARVALTPGWTADYTITGNDWKQLGDMGNDDEAQRKEFILSQLRDAGGDPLMAPEANRSEEKLQAEREKIWATFTAQFSSQ